MKKIAFIIVLLMLLSFSIIPVVADSGWDNSYGGSSSSDSSSSHDSSSSNSSSSSNRDYSFLNNPLGVTNVSIMDMYLISFCLAVITYAFTGLIYKKKRFDLRILLKILKILIILTIIVPLIMLILLLPLFFIAKSNMFIIMFIILLFLLLFLTFIYLSNIIEKNKFNKMVKKITKRIRKVEDKNNKEKTNMLIKSYNNDEEILKKLENIFIDVQLAWMNFDYDKLKELCSSELYASYKSDLEVLNKQDGQNVMENFKPIRSEIAYVKEDRDKVFVTFILNIRFKDYVINTKNSEVIKGSTWYVYDNCYELEFMINKKILNKCPNCGADVDGNECKYCDTVFTNNNKDYVLLNKKLITRNL